MDTKVIFTPERFNDPRYSRPRYRLRSNVKLAWQLGSGGFSHGSYKFKRDPSARLIGAFNEGAEQKVLS